MNVGIDCYDGLAEALREDQVSALGSYTGKLHQPLATPWHDASESDHRTCECAKLFGFLIVEPRAE